MTIRFPRPLRPGDRIGVTSPSSGVPSDMWPRMEASIAALRERGYEVVLGECMSGDRVTSAPKEQRAAELVGMLCDPEIAAVVPPWGGELAIDLLDQRDWPALHRAEQRLASVAPRPAATGFLARGARHVEPARRSIQRAGVGYRRPG